MKASSEPHHQTISIAAGVISFLLLGCGFACHVIWSYGGGDLILIEGAIFLMSAVLAAIWHTQTAEMYRRMYKWTAERGPVYRFFYEGLGGERVSTVHRVLAINQAIVFIAWSLICFAIGSSLLSQR